MEAFNADATLGALQIGVLISTFLFGALTIQTYVYYTTFHKDDGYIRGLVAIIWLLELGHSISISHALYVMTISDYGQPQKLIKTPDSLNAAVLFSGLVGPIVQVFFANRVRVFSKSLIIPIICWALSFLRCLGSMAASAEGFMMVTLVRYEVQWKWLLTTVLSIGAAVDVIIAASLCYYLRQSSRTTAFESSAQLVDRLIRWTIETGLVTSIAAVVMLICFLAMKSNFAWLAIFTFLAKLFSNSLLAMLNGRTALRQIRGTDTASSTYAHGSSSTAAPQFNRIAIEMTKSTKLDSDLEMGGYSKGSVA